MRFTNERAMNTPNKKKSLKINRWKTSTKVRETRRTDKTQIRQLGKVLTFKLRDSQEEPRGYHNSQQTKLGTLLFFPRQHNLN